NFNPFTNLTVKKVKTIVQQLKNGIDLKSIASNPTSKIQYIPSEDKTIIFRNYKTGIALSKLKQKNPTEVLNIITKSELSGRGGAFFPTAKKWLACKESESVKKYIICNADEGEPGTFKDKSVIENMPGLLIEGMIIAAYITGAKEGFIYLRAEYKFLQKKLENTLEYFYQNAFLGKNICGIKNFDFNIKIQLGAGSYVCGEEKALIESLEGKRGEPRVQKYFPTEFGYLGHSTVVNNVETFAKAARIVELGANFISTVGTDISKGTKLLSISGDVAKPGIYEIEWGMSVRQLLKLCEALSPYYIQISGPSGECINSSEFDRQICEEDLVCGGSIMVFNRSRSVLQIQENFLKFFKMESCGVCTPCRAGNQILLEKVKKFNRGLCTQKDIDEIKQWGKIIKLSSRCGLGKSAPNSLLMSIDKFEDYFKQKISPARENHTIEFDMERAIQEYDSIIKETQL
uniref:NADH-ubiquinone oxidoreductase-F iron-sulfur binding region domain-containing protein n=1 Tax=Lutibacter sp. TaxID=1925666 RepID=UPI0035618AC4